MLQVNEVYFTADSIRRASTSQVQASNHTEQFTNLFRETEIQLDIAAKASKLPDPHVWVDPKAISRMAKDKVFYDKVMDKINSFTSDPHIPLYYPHITYSLIVEEDGEWLETMVNEELKKRCEESGENKDENKSIYEMLQIESPLLPATQSGLPTDLIYDYSRISVEFRKRNSR